MNSRRLNALMTSDYQTVLHVSLTRLLHRDGEFRVGVKSAITRTSVAGVKLPSTQLTPAIRSTLTMPFCETGEGSDSHAPSANPVRRDEAVK